jgi:hypothetical protein
MTRELVASDDEEGVGDSGKQSVGSIDEEKVFLRFIVGSLVAVEWARPFLVATTGIEVEALNGAHSQ